MLSKLELCVGAIHMLEDSHKYSEGKSQVRGREGETEEEQKIDSSPRKFCMVYTRRRITWVREFSPSKLCMVYTRRRITWVIEFSPSKLCMVCTRRRITWVIESIVQASCGVHKKKDHMGPLALAFAMAHLLFVIWNLVDLASREREISKL